MHESAENELLTGSEETGCLVGLDGGIGLPPLVQNRKVLCSQQTCETFSQRAQIFFTRHERCKSVILRHLRLDLTQIVRNTGTGRQRSHVRMAKLKPSLVMRVSGVFQLFLN